MLSAERRREETASRSLPPVHRRPAAPELQALPFTPASKMPVAALGQADLPLMLCGFGLTLLVSFLLGYHRIFWEDEMLGWMLLHDPSWHHMLSAWRLGADGGGITFYVTGRLWFWIFGASEISFRMYSAVGFGAAFCVVWAMLRRFYTRGPVFFAVFNTWFFSQTIVTHMAEGRFYGLMMLCASLALLLVVLADQHARTPPWIYGASLLVHAALVTSHVLGVVYSAAALAALVTLDRLPGRLRLPLYLTIVSTWLLLLAERQAIAATAAVGRPFFWTTQPNLSRWIGAYSAYGAEIAAVLVLLLATALLTLWRAPGGLRTGLQNAFRARTPAYVLAAALLLVPVALFLPGTVGPSLFINRYLMPVAIAQCLLTAEAITLTDWRLLLGRIADARWLPYTAAASLLAAILLWDLGHVAHVVMPRKDYTVALTESLPHGIPVLCEDAWAFTELIGRQHASGVRYLYLLDWTQSTRASAPRLEVTQFHLMQNWQRAGYFAGSIEDFDRFLKANPRFLIFHQGGPLSSAPPFIGNPLLARFQADPRYEVEPYRPGGEDLWLVCRGRCQP